QLQELLPLARREALAAFGNDEVYLEKLLERARHVEVQLLGDHHGTLVHLFERDCTVQRRNQKVVERAPAVFLTPAQREELSAAALAIGRAAHYRNAGTVEFLHDAGTAYSGAIITRSYDSLLVKVTAWSPTPEETIARMHRALAEFRVRGVVTNLRFLDQLITHARFARGEYTTRFIDDTPELFHGPRKRDRATRLLSYLGTLIVNGNDETRARARPRPLTAARLPPGPLPAPAPGTKQRLDELGPERFAAWMLAEQRV